MKLKHKVSINIQECAEAQYRCFDAVIQGSACGMSDFLIYVNNYSIVAIEREDAKPDHLNYQIPKF